MAFFPRQFYHPQATASFTPLFRLLDDFDSYSRQCAPESRKTGMTHFQPKFDIREVRDAYELHGELPGVSKENVQIEFTEPQTMVIKGKIERVYSAGTPPNGAPVEDEDTAIANNTAENDDTSSQKSCQATVEDEADSEAHESGFEEVESPNKQVQKPVEEKPVEKKQPADKAKYWLTERSIGQFSRSFNFPARVDQDNVTASFKDGILTVTVPKAKKHESVRITVN